MLNRVKPNFGFIYTQRNINIPLRITAIRRNGASKKRLFDLISDAGTFVQAYVPATGEIESTTIIEGTDADITALERRCTFHFYKDVY